MAQVVDKLTHDFTIYEKRRLKGQYIVAVVPAELSSPLILWPTDGEPFYWKQETACILEFDGYVYFALADSTMLQTTFVVAQISKKYEKFNCVVLTMA